MTISLSSTSLSLKGILLTVLIDSNLLPNPYPPPSITRWQIGSQPPSWRLTPIPRDPGPPTVIEAGATVGHYTIIYASATIHANVTIGDRCTLHPYSVVKASATLGEGCRVEEGAVVGVDARLGPGCFIGPDCGVGTAAELGPGVMLLDRTRLPGKATPATVGAGAKVGGGAVIAGMKVGEGAYVAAVEAVAEPRRVAAVTGRGSLTARRAGSATSST